jgi:hypothetical protein
MSERVPGPGNGKITAAHRRRDAVIYLLSELGRGFSQFRGGF